MKHKLNVRLKNKQIRLFKEYTKKLTSQNNLNQFIYFNLLIKIRKIHQKIKYKKQYKYFLYLEHLLHL